MAPFFQQQKAAPGNEPSFQRPSSAPQPVRRGDAAGARQPAPARRREAGGRLTRGLPAGTGLGDASTAPDPIYRGGGGSRGALSSALQGGLCGPALIPTASAGLREREGRWWRSSRRGVVPRPPWARGSAGPGPAWEAFSRLARGARLRWAGRRRRERVPAAVTP